MKITTNIGGGGGSSSGGPIVGGGGFVAADTAPEETSYVWIDTGNSNIMKFYNGTDWVPVTAAWAE